MSRRMRFSTGSIKRPPSYSKMADKPAEFLTTCADCGASNPTWASINHGVLICFECCSVHRSLGKQISHIRSLTSPMWPKAQKEMVLHLAHKGVNSMWEYSIHHPTPGVKVKHRKPTVKDRLHPTKSEFITAKYKSLSLIPRLTRDKDSRSAVADLSKQLHACARTSNLETCLRLIVHGADPNYMHPERGSTPLHVAALAGQSMQVELLIVHGADPCTLDRLGHTPDECARIAGHHDLAERIIECQYEVTDCLSFFLFGRMPAHSSGEHFLLPSNLSNASRNGLDGSAAHSKLSDISNTALEELASDVYDEMDRREADTMWVATQQLESLVAFLPVNPTLSALRNQARQKLATLDKNTFSQLVVDVLNECYCRQQKSMRSDSSDQPPSGRLVPSGSTDLEMMADTHDYDEVPLEDATEEEEEVETTKSTIVAATEGREMIAAEQPEPTSYAEELSEVTEKLQKTEARMAKVQKTNEILSHQVRDLTIEVEMLKEENTQLRQQLQRQQQEGAGKRRKEAHSMPPTDMPPIIEPLSRESSTEPPATPIDPYMTVTAALEEMQAVKGSDPPPSTDRHYSKVDMDLKHRMRQEREAKKALPSPDHADAARRDLSFEEIDVGIGQLTRSIQELLEAAQTQKTHRLSLSCDKVTQAVDRLTELFLPKPKTPEVEQALNDLVTASSHLHDEHRSTKAKGDTAQCVQQVVVLAFDVAKAARKLVTKAEVAYKSVSAKQ